MSEHQAHDDAVSSFKARDRSKDEAAPSYAVQTLPARVGQKKVRKGNRERGKNKTKREAKEDGVIKKDNEEEFEYGPTHDGSSDDAGTDDGWQ